MRTSSILAACMLLTACARSLGAHEPFTMVTAIDGHRAVVAARDGRVCLLDATTHAFTWCDRGDGALLGAPIRVSNDKLALIKGNELRMLALADGSLASRVPIADLGPAATLVFEDGVIVVANTGASALGIPTAEGKVVWTQPNWMVGANAKTANDQQWNEAIRPWTGQRIDDVVCVAGRHAYQERVELDATPTRTYLDRLDLRTGAISRSDVATDHAPWSCALVDDEAVFFFDDGRRWSIAGPGMKLVELTFRDRPRPDARTAWFVYGDRAIGADVRNGQILAIVPVLAGSAVVSGPILDVEDRITLDRDGTAYALDQIGTLHVLANGLHDTVMTTDGPVGWSLHTAAGVTLVDVTTLPTGSMAVQHDTFRAPR